MYRIGVIGTENSHALAFAKIINLKDEKTGEFLYPDAKIVGVYGPDLASAQRIIDEANAEFIPDSPEDFLGKIDAMIITCRKGSLHSKYAKFFIENKIPCFIDKPFTVDLAEGKALIDLAKSNGVPLCGGSGCKLAYDVLMLQNEFESMQTDGSFITGMLNFPADPDSEYDGFYFYASHLVEMALTVFGSEVQSLVAFEKNKSRVCLLRYADYDITLNFTKDAKQYTGVLFSKEHNTVRNIDISLIFKHEVEHYMHMLRTHEMPQPYCDLIKPIEIINAIEKSIALGMEINLAK